MRLAATQIFKPMLLVFLALAFASGCASRGTVPTQPTAQANTDAKPSLFNAPYLVKGNGKHRLKSQWLKQIGGDDGLQLMFRPALAEDKACAAGRDAVYCFSRENGKPLWKRKVRDLSAGIVITDASAFVGTDEGEIIALDINNGSEQWRTAVGGEILALVGLGETPIGHMVVAHSSSGLLTGLNATDGASVWVQEQKVPRLTLRGLSTPLVVEDIVVTGYDNGRVVANKLQDGSIVWQEDLVVPTGRSELERLADVDGALAYYRGDVFAASWGGQLGAWSLKKGRSLWRADIASVSGVAADLRRVYVTDSSNALHSLDARSGRALWKRDDLVAEDEADERRVISTSVIDGRPLVLDNRGRLYLYERATGELDFATSLSGEFATAPAVEGLSLLTLSRGGSLALWQLQGNK